MKNKIFIYGLIAVACYATFKFGGPSKFKGEKTGKQDYTEIIKVQSKDISECSIATDKDVVFHPKNLEMYTDMEQGCSYKIWTSGSTINDIEHVINDGCTRYYPDSTHNF